MRWSIIRLIWFRELRDQSRDRRTIFMMAVLPLVLYPVVGLGLMQFALGFSRKTNTVGIVGANHLPSRKPLSAGLNPLPATTWLTLNPAGDIASLAGVTAQATLVRQGLGQDDPPLVLIEKDAGRFPTFYFDTPRDAESLVVKSLPDVALFYHGDLDDWVSDVDRTPLDSKQVEALVLVPPDFQERLERGERPTLIVLSREGDDRSRLVSLRVHGAISAWKNRLKEVHFLRHGFSADFDDPVDVKDPQLDKSPAKQASESLLDMLVKLFPFMIVMWSLAGALYPAVDLCAGEKERGTMETLLISPAGREEIVLGKFLAIWVFSAATAFLNLLSMGATTWKFRDMLPHDALHPAGLMWCVLLVLPLSAFFSALCLAIGAYARSSKEGQYYLMPLFLLTMPLVFLSLAPGVELNPFYSMVPVTGVALLMQRLLTSASPDQTAFFYLVPVLAPMALYSWFALRWAIELFNREEVLFREAERLDVGLWIRHLFREKEALPSTGQALFCFALIILLRFASFGMGDHLSLEVLTAVSFVAFLAPPPLFMAILLTTRPRLGLGLAWPPLSALLLAGVLAILVLPPRVELKQLILDQFPNLNQVRKENHPLTEGLYAFSKEELPRPPVWQLLLVVAILPAICEELAFRGFILSGLCRRYGPRKAILLSSFLFALYHMNVFKFAPAFALGAILGSLTIRSRSILPAMLFQGVHNGLRVGLVLLQDRELLETEGWPTWVRWAIVVFCAISVLVMLGRIVWELAPNVCVSSVGPNAESMERPGEASADRTKDVTVVENPVNSP